ncbi:lysozyme inhibitor LprI family protein [Symplocastrum sp. BBK-W-15]|uniref:Lysozyme inhibitor LprI family protein n=2 Tax=Limnofasciculus TaxID=3064905 RepID=A0AAE3GU18_9CYAN|nr:lysozyme inhibitor LprI family protein [Limnofasciculus baicalensis BBK-W-15]
MRLTRQQGRNLAVLSAATLLLMPTTPAASLPDNELAQQINCRNPTSNVEYKECAYRAYQAADRRLNQVYQQVISTVTGEEKQKLIDTELAWIKFRDLHCEFEVYKNRGGSGYGGFLSECLEQVTNERTAQLESFLNGN